MHTRPLSTRTDKKYAPYYRKIRLCRNKIFDATFKCVGISKIKETKDYRHKQFCPNPENNTVNRTLRRITFGVYKSQTVSRAFQQFCARLSGMGFKQSGDTDNGMRHTEWDPRVSTAEFSHEGKHVRCSCGSGRRRQRYCRTTCRSSLCLCRK